MLSSQFEMHEFRFGIRESVDYFVDSFKVFLFASFGTKESLELKKSYFFLSGQAVPPLSGRAIKKKTFLWLHLLPNEAYEKLYMNVQNNQLIIEKIPRYHI